MSDSSEVRKRLAHCCPTDEEFDAFCFDRFRSSKAMFARGQSRLQKENLLLEREGPDAVSAAIDMAFGPATATAESAATATASLRSSATPAVIPAVPAPPQQAGASPVSAPSATPPGTSPVEEPAPGQAVPTRANPPELSPNGGDSPWLRIGAPIAGLLVAAAIVAGVVNNVSCRHDPPCDAPNHLAPYRNDQRICVSPAMSDFLACLEASKLNEAESETKNAMHDVGSIGTVDAQVSASIEATSVQTIKTKYDTGPNATAMNACVRVYGPSKGILPSDLDASSLASDASTVQSGDGSASPSRAASWPMAEPKQLLRLENVPPRAPGGNITAPPRSQVGTAASGPQQGRAETIPYVRTVSANSGGTATGIRYNGATGPVHGKVDQVQAVGPGSTATGIEINMTAPAGSH
jgi:hypothetical protein